MHSSLLRSTVVSIFAAALLSPALAAEPAKPAPKAWPRPAAKNEGLSAPQEAALMPKGPAPQAAPGRKAKRVPRAVPTPSASGELVLNAGWELIEAPAVTAAPEAIAKTGFDGAKWYDATVPGTVLTTLIEQGVYPDPYYGLNNLAIPESLARQDYWYRTEFPTPAACRGRRAVLTFHGVNYRAEVWLNAKKLGTIAGAFTRGVFDVTDALAPDGFNALAVRVSPPPHPGIPQEQSMAQPGGPNGGQLCRDGPTFICTEGWDWIPGIRDRCAGLWQDVVLRPTGPVRLADPHVVTDLPLPDTSRAELRVSVDLVNTTTAEVRGTLRGTFEGGAFEQAVTLAGGATQTVGCDPARCPALAVKNPRLWWPNGYGAPELYTMTLSFTGADGRESDRAAVRFGIREITVELPLAFAADGVRRVEYRPTDRGPAGGPDPIDRRASAMTEVSGTWVMAGRDPSPKAPVLVPADDPAMAQQMAVRVNGQRILCVGGNWGIDDALKRCSRAYLEPYVRLHRDAHVTMIRNWCGQSTGDALFDLCDEYGLLVWNDFWVSTEGYNMDPDDKALFLANVRDTILRARNHPSVALWCGRNEGVPDDALNDGIDALVAQFDGTRHYQPNSRQVNLLPSGPWDAKPIPAYFDALGKGFTTEMGVPSVPAAETIRTFMPASEQWPISDTWAHHDWHMKANGNPEAYRAMMTAQLGEAKSLDDFCRKAQLMDYANHRAIYEGANSRLWKPNSGRLLWMTHPAWPSLVWQMYTWDYDTHGAYSGVQKACEPLHIQLHPTNGQISVVNHTLAPHAGLTAKVTLYELAGGVLTQATAALDVPANTICDALKCPAGAGAVHFAQLELLDAAGARIGENFYWRANRDADLAALDTMPRVDLAATARCAVEAGTARVEVEVRNPSRHVALLARLSVRDAKTGVRVKPAYYAENFISLPPGVVRTVGVEIPAASAPEKLVLGLEGWNVTPSRVPVRDAKPWWKRATGR